jgi:hypothetical protein
MSLQGYQQLQSHSQNDATLLGNHLPKLINAGIEIQSEQLTTEKMREKIYTFSAQQGWVMYRDEVVISSETPTRSDIIEGEWTNNSDTLKVKLIGSDLFQVTQIKATQDKANCVFSEQRVMLRNSLKGEYNTALYRCWWQQASGEDYKGRWLPLTQQFIGFSNNKEQQ